MNHFFLNTDEQGSMEFLCWKSLPYRKRLIVSFVSIMIGFVLQISFYSLLPGVVLVFIGNLFLLPRGVSNVAKVGSFEPQADWVKVEEKKLAEMITFNRQISKWDRTPMDTTNPVGGCLFFLLLSVLTVLVVWGFTENIIYLQILSVNAAVLLIPYWITGWRAGFRATMTLSKIKLIKAVIEKSQSFLMGCPIDYYFFISQAQMPSDVKFKVNIPGQHEDFLGFHGQISINRNIYLYFYTVLVARKGYGLETLYRQYNNPKTITKEFNVQKDVEVLVIRQNTTQVTNGYITSEKQALAIFHEGLILAKKAAIKD